MRPIPLAAIVLLAGVVACQEAVTAPSNRDLTIRMDEGNPPPPPIDSGMVGLAGDGSGSTSTFSLNTTFFFNKPGNNGWISFSSSDNVIASPNARLHFSNGGFSAHGIILVTLNGGTLNLDLSTVNPRSTFGDGSCSPAGGDADVIGGDCTVLLFNGETFTNADGGTSTMDVSLRFLPPDPCRASCPGDGLN